FRPAPVQNTQNEPVVDRESRDCYFLTDLGVFDGLLRTRFTGIGARALEKLGIFDVAVEPREFVICAYNDGGHFAPHVDTFKTPKGVRVLSCIYYFASRPAHFSGGVLRLHSFPRADDKARAVETIEIS